MERVRILFLAANPATTTRLVLDEAARVIEAKIRAAGHHDAFELIPRACPRPDARRAGAVGSRAPAQEPLR